MARRIVHLALVMVLLAMAGCTAAGPSVYGPLLGRFGYVQKKLDNGDWRVTFTANRFTSRATTETYALYRAAELTLADGFPRFAVMDHTFDHHTERTYAYREFPPGHETMEGRLSGGILDPFESTRLVTSEWLAATLVVRPYRGTPPAGTTRVYDARAEIDRLGPSVKRR